MLSALINRALIPDTQGVVFYALFTAAALALGLCLILFLNDRQGRTLLHEQQDFRETLYRRMIERRIAIESEGELEVKLGADSGTVSSYMTGTVPDAIGSLIILIGATVLIALADWRIAIVFTLMNLLQLVPPFIYEKWARKAYVDVRNDEEAYRSWLVEGHRGMRTIKAFGLEAWFIKRFRGLNKKVYLSGKRAERVGTVETIVFEIINAVTSYGSYIVVGMFSLLWGTPVDRIPILIILGENLFSSIDDIYGLRISRFSFDEAKKRIAEIAAPEAETLGGESILSVCDIEKSFKEKAVLKDVSLEIHENERLLLHGGNGSGKTTLLKIMLGLLKPDDGIVLMKEGVRISSALQQEPRLAVTGAELIAALCEAGEADGDALYSVAAGFGLTGELLARSLDMYSGGELKKLYLSAAFAKRAELIVLDEPTNHIDADSAEYLLSLIKARRGAVLVCSHDERLLRLDWDSIYTVKEGRLYG